MHVDGDLCEATEQYIAHQCNCTTTGARGLTKQMFRVFPHANVYKAGTPARTPGTIRVLPPPDQDQDQGQGQRRRERERERGVVAIFGQRNPGSRMDRQETARMRERWFAQCLGELARVPGLRSVAFPYQIGCGLAGGDWCAYEGMLSDFAAQNPGVRCVVYRLRR